MSIRNNGAIFDALFNKIINVHISWAPNIDWLDDDFDEMCCFWYLREPLQLTLHCSGWINEDDYRESVYKQPIWWSGDDWNLVSDYIYDPADEYFAPTSDENVWRV
jgi:hypothetical protein